MYSLPQETSTFVTSNGDLEFSKVNLLVTYVKNYSIFRKIFQICKGRNDQKICQVIDLCTQMLDHDLDYKNTLDFMK